MAATLEEIDYYRKHWDELVKPRDSSTTAEALKERYRIRVHYLMFRKRRIRYELTCCSLLPYSPTVRAWVAAHPIAPVDASIPPRLPGDFPPK